MSRSQQRLGRQIFRSTAKRCRLGISFDIFLGQAKISDLSKAILPDQDILRFQISVNDVVIMKFLESEQYARRIKPGSFLFELPDLLQVEE